MVDYNWAVELVGMLVVRYQIAGIDYNSDFVPVVMMLGCSLIEEVAGYNLVVCMLVVAVDNNLTGSLFE